MSVLLSNILDFLSWSYWLTAPLFIVLLFILCGMVTSKGQAFLVALLAGSALTAAIPNLNHAYLVAAGAQRSAVIEKVTRFTTFIPNPRHPTRPIENERIDLLVTGAHGETWSAAVHRNAGILGPHALPGLRLTGGDDVVVAVVDGAPANVVIITQASPASWQAGLRHLDAGWAISPPTDNWVSHAVFRRQIEDFLAAFRSEIGADAVARLESRLDSLTLFPPDDLPPDIVERIGG